MPQLLYLTSSLKTMDTERINQQFILSQYGFVWQEYSAWDSRGQYEVNTSKPYSFDTSWTHESDCGTVDTGEIRCMDTCDRRLQNWIICLSGLSGVVYYNNGKPSKGVWLFRLKISFLEWFLFVFSHKWVSFENTIYFCIKKEFSYFGAWLKFWTDHFKHLSLGFASLKIAFTIFEWLASSPSPLVSQVLLVARPFPFHPEKITSVFCFFVFFF